MSAPSFGYENGQAVPIHTDDLSASREQATTARDIATAGFVGYMEWINGRYTSQSRQNVRYRALAARWVTDPTVFREIKQKDFAKKNGLRPDTFCRAVNRFSKRFGIANEKMRLRADSPTFVSSYRSGKKWVLPAVPRKRVP